MKWSVRWWRRRRRRRQNDRCHLWTTTTGPATVFPHRKSAVFSKSFVARCLPDFFPAVTTRHELTEFDRFALVGLEQGRQVDVVVLVALLELLPAPEKHLPVGADQEVQEGNQARSARRGVGLDAQNPVPERVDPVEGVVVVVTLLLVVVSGAAVLFGKVGVRVAHIVFLFFSLLLSGYR